MACFPKTLTNNMRPIMAGKVRATPQTTGSVWWRTREKMATLLAQCAANGQNIGIDM